MATDFCIISRFKEILRCENEGFFPAYLSRQTSSHARAVCYIWFGAPNSHLLSMRLNPPANYCLLLRMFFSNQQFQNLWSHKWYCDTFMVLVWGKYSHINLKWTMMSDLRKWWNRYPTRSQKVSPENRSHHLVVNLATFTIKKAKTTKRR